MSELKDQYTIWKLLIDERYQNRGYGRAAVELAVHYLVNEHKAESIYLSVAKQNTAAKSLYDAKEFAMKIGRV